MVRIHRVMVRTGGLSVLILGGSAFLGIAIRERLLDRGHRVTLFNRGKTDAAEVAGVRSVHGDRQTDLSRLGSERFDAVVDTSGYLPHVVGASSRFFESRARRYLFISTVSVYDLKSPEIFEDSPRAAMPPGASLYVVDGESYGPLKTRCERVVANTFGSRATIVRPGLIVGPNDRSDRFTYWPLRFARGGEVLAPGAPEAPVQFVDVRDLAAFAVGLLERNAAGDYNVTSPQGMFTMGDVLAACAAVARVPSHVRWVDEAALIERGVAPWMDLPLWIPAQLGIPGLLNTNVRKALVAGLRIRPLRETVLDTLRFALSRPRGYALRAGLAPEREAELLLAQQ